MDEKKFNLRTAGNSMPRRPGKSFRLEERITLAASDKYNDPYVCSVTAHKIRDRFVVSVQITHEPVQTLVYNNSWLFEDMETCWSKYHVIKNVIEDIRDFVEAEGIKNVVFQYIVKHSLSAISADIENMYETAVPSARTIVDKSSRGNLIKNFPYMPFRSQSGPDQLDQVFTSVGNAENPIPKDLIGKDEQIAPYQHQRKEHGMKDILPCPISAFQEAAGITRSMFRGAAAQGTIKTAEKDEDSDPADAFLEKVRLSTPGAIEHGKNLAMQHYVAMTNAPVEEAEAFYNAVKAACSDVRAVLNISARNLISFLATGEYTPVGESPELLSKFNHYANKREQAERALGCYGMSPVYASITMLPEGDKGYGECAVALREIADRTVLLCGDSFRVRNPSRGDYVSDPSLILYAHSEIAHCKAASIIIAMQQHDLAGGPALAMDKILSRGHEFGRCEALIFKKVTPKNVASVLADNERDAAKIRRVLCRLGTMFPVSYSRLDPKISSPSADNEPKDEPAVHSIQQRHFVIGDRVALKPMASHPKALGTIIDVVNGAVTVQWDNKTRGVYDMVEALMRLMDAPGTTTESAGMVVYSLPGMDDESVMALSACGLDPVTIYSLASHHRPAAPNAMGWKEDLVNSLILAGVPAKLTKGYVSMPDGDLAFQQHEWIEAGLPNGARLVVDVAYTMKIVAGDPDEYILPDPQPNIEVE